MKLNRRLFLVSIAVTAAGPAFAASPRPIDLMRDFWPIYYGPLKAGDAMEARVGALQSAFFERYADIYEGAGVKVSDERLSKWLPLFDAMAADVRHLWHGFARDYHAHQKHFRKALPDFDEDKAPVYLMPSLFNFDGHLQPWQGKVPLFLGLDGIVKYHGAGADLSVLLDHESFHLYQAQIYPEQSLDETPAVYVALWMEGCATYASQVMNPKASRLNVLLDDKPLSQATSETVQATIIDMLGCLESRDEKDYGRFFYANNKNLSLSRSGYLVGFLLAERIGKRMTLQEMARVRNDALLPLIRAELEAMRTS